MSDPTSRALSLLGLLGSQAAWTGDELARRLGVTTRTLRRDVDRLRAMGYTVDADTGPGGGYRLGRGQVLPPLLLDEEQAVAVTWALTRAAQEGEGPLAEAALRALATLDEVIPVPLRRRVAALREAVLVWPVPGVVSAALLLPCAEAVRRCVRLSFDYRDRHGVHSARRVEPHRLVARGRTWWLVAYDLDRDDWRSFRLDRLTAPVPGTWRFTPRGDLDQALARLDEPAPPEAWRHQARVRIHAPVEEVAASLPALAGEVIGVDDITTEFRAGANEPASAAWWLARLHHDFTVVGDEAIRDAVRALGERLRRAVGWPQRAGASRLSRARHPSQESRGQLVGRLLGQDLGPPESPSAVGKARRARR